MSRAKNRMLRDKAVRDAALNLFKTDLAVIRSELGARTLGARLADRLGDGAAEILDDTIGYAEENRGKVGAIIAATMLWFGRGPILRAAGLTDDNDDDEHFAEPDEDTDGSKTR